MTKRLYEVEVERRVTMVVFANDEDEALILAEENAAEESDNQRGGWDAIGLPVVITKPPRGWKGSIPYGDDVDDRCVEDILAEPTS